MTAIEKLKAYNESQGYGTSDADIFEILQEEAKEVHEEEFSGSRWWNTKLKVVELDSTFYQFIDAYTTGDMSPREAGWEFDIKSIKEVKPVTETITITKYI